MIRMKKEKNSMKRKILKKKKNEWKLTMSEIV